MEIDCLIVFSKEGNWGIMAQDHLDPLNEVIGKQTIMKGVSRESLIVVMKATFDHYPLCQDVQDLFFWSGEEIATSLTSWLWSVLEKLQRISKRCDNIEKESKKVEIKLTDLEEKLRHQNKETNSSN